MLYEEFNERELLADWFQNALAENGFETWFQPVVDTAGHRIIGHECLTRVGIDKSSSRDKSSSPGKSSSLDKSRRVGDQIRDGDEIIEAARNGNQLALFDARAMALAVRSAAAQHPHLQSRAMSDLVSSSDLVSCTESRPGVFFINMLPGLMADPAEYMRLAMEALAAARQTSELRPQDLVFEAVDSDFAGDSARLRAAHDYVREQGCGFSLDNAGLGLGTGSGMGLGIGLPRGAGQGGRPEDPGSYCFETIRDLRPDYVKIDRRLVANVERPVCASTIRKLVEVGDRYGAQVIAVGVERPRTAENLWLLGVQAMQGYLFGRPSRQIVYPGEPEELLTAGSNLANLARAIEAVPRNPASGSVQVWEEQLTDEQFAIVYRPELITQEMPAEKESAR